MELEIFVTPGCGRCVFFRNLLAEAGLSGREVDVSAHLGALRRLMRLGGRPLVPAVALGGPGAERFWPAHTPELAREAVAALAEEMSRG